MDRVGCRMTDVRPFELRWRWPDRVISRLRLWSVRIVFWGGALLGGGGGSGPAGPWELGGAIVGTVLGAILVSILPLYALSHEGEPDATGSADQTMYCTACGAEQSVRNVYCTSCGEKVRGEDSDAATA